MMTPRQAEVMMFIRQACGNGAPPSVSEVAIGCDMWEENVWSMLVRLEERGMAERFWNGHSCAIRPSEKYMRMVRANG